MTIIGVINMKFLTRFDELTKFCNIYLQAAEEHDCAIFVHPWDMQMDGRMKKYWLPWLVGMPGETAQAICCLIFGGILERFPKLKVMFAHGGTVIFVLLLSN